MKLFIGCSSSNELNKIYYEECQKYFDYLLKENDLVFGAYNDGLMGLAYKIAKENKRDIYAVATLKNQDSLNDLDCCEKIVKESVVDRTKKLINLCDMIMIFPGGFGSLHEVITAIDAKRSGEFNKPIIICNINHFYDELIVFLNKIYDEKFTDISVKNDYVVINTLEELKNCFKKNN